MSNDKNILGVTSGYKIVRVGRPRKGERFICPKTGHYVKWLNDYDGEYICAIVEFKNSIDKFNEFIAENNVQVGSYLKVSEDFPGVNQHIRGKVVQVIAVDKGTQCFHVKYESATITVAFEYCQKVVRRMMPWDMDTMPERVKVKLKEGSDEIYWARPSSSSQAIIGTRCWKYLHLFESFIQPDGSPCGAEIYI